MIDKPSNNHITPLSSSSNEQTTNNPFGSTGEGNLTFNNLETSNTSTPAQYNPNFPSFNLDQQVLLSLNRRKRN